MVRTTFAILFGMLPCATAMAQEQETEQETAFTYRPSIAVKPGKELLVKGVRGRSCRDPAPEWEEVAAKLPTSATGTFSDGGLGTVRSRKCGKVVPARGIKFTATTKGREKLSVFRDRVAVTVF